MKLEIGIIGEIGKGQAECAGAAAEIAYSPIAVDPASEIGECPQAFQRIAHPEGTCEGICRTDIVEHLDLTSAFDCVEQRNGVHVWAIDVMASEQDVGKLVKMSCPFFRVCHASLSSPVLAKEGFLQARLKRDW